LKQISQSRLDSGLGLSHFSYESRETPLKLPTSRPTAAYHARLLEGLVWYTYMCISIYMYIHIHMYTCMYQYIHEHF
jgi:hypothetical protein